MLRRWGGEDIGKPDILQLVLQPLQALTTHIDVSRTSHGFQQARGGFVLSLQLRQKPLLQATTLAHQMHHASLACMHVYDLQLIQIKVHKTMMQK
jgi:hypothetical protein